MSEEAADSLHGVTAGINGWWAIAIVWGTMSAVQPVRWRALFGTFAYAANEMSGNILVVYPPSGQMENYISGRSLAE